MEIAEMPESNLFSLHMPVCFMLLLESVIV